MMTPEWRRWRRSGVFIVNYENVSYLFPNVPVIEFEQVNICREGNIGRESIKVGHDD